MIACANGNEDVVKLLLDLSHPNIELNARGNNGVTAFMIACHWGHKDVVKLILDHSERIDLNAKRNSGMTAFMIACSYRYKDVVKLLLDHNDSSIDLNAFYLSFDNSFVCTALMLACSWTIPKELS